MNKFENPSSINSLKCFSFTYFIFSQQETVPISTKEAGGTMPVHILTLMECGIEEAITEASIRMGFFGLNIEEVHTP